MYVHRRFIIERQHAAHNITIEVTGEWGAPGWQRQVQLGDGLAHLPESSPKLLASTVPPDVYAL